jgi:sugar phosphate isomerase/epimerase
MRKSKKIKLSIAVATENALSTAFVVFRGFSESIKKAADLGYDGIELALKDASEVGHLNLPKILNQTNMEVSCISTGQVFSDTGLMFTDVDNEKRKKIKMIFKEFIDLASDFGRKVNIGRVRGYIQNNRNRSDEQRFIDMTRDLCDYALPKKVTLILEPVNRYEINFINSVADGVKLMKQVDRPNIKLMPDIFHMNIEDVSIGKELAKNIDHIEYIHLADSNRLAPGWGHTNFEDIFNHLKNANYEGWMAVEILPKPTATAAAKQAIEYLKPYFEKYNT